MKPHKILITGCAGYIGSVMARLMLEQGHEVWGIDSLLFGDRGIAELKDEERFHFYQGDVRKGDYYSEVLPKVDAIVHLAAISGMPSCDKYPDLARETNLDSTLKLYDLANEYPHIQRFILASTTSIFGATETGEIVDENSPPRPLSLYAETKLKSETHLLTAPRRESLISVPLRFPTAFGLSPRMRFDLTVNEFTRNLSLGQELKIFGEKFWRPYCHVRDLSRACLFMIDADAKLVDRQVFCVGEENQNYTKKMIYEALLELIPQAKISMVPKIEDARDYKVNFSKIQKIGYRISKTVKDGIQEIHHALQKGQISHPFDPAHGSLMA